LHLARVLYGRAAQIGLKHLTWLTATLRLPRP
jgi:hypothetical protein